ncbi:MAG: hypothetical protein RIR91_2002 [Verrucomicrobiota bacterium]|jgi:hypothetical protein
MSRAARDYVQFTPRLKGFDAYTQALNEYRLFSGKCMRDVVIEEAALTARELMVFTPPLVQGGGKGLSKAAEVAGKTSVEKDIKSIFNSTADPEGRSAFSLMGMAVVAGDRSLFEKARKEGVMTTKSKGIFRGVLDDEDPERAYRQFSNRFRAAFEAKAGQTIVKDLKGTHDAIKAKYAGRIRKNNGPGIPKELREIADAAAMKAYIKKQQQNVGRLKAGWLDVIMSLPKPETPGIQKNFGVKGVPAWVFRNRSSTGYTSFSGQPNTANFGMIIGNSIGDNDGVSTDAKTLERVMAVRTGKLFKRAEALMVWGADKFNRN